MKNKTFLIIYIILAAALTYWAYPIIKSRYFSPTIEIDEESQDSNQNRSNSHEINLEEIEEDEDIDSEDGSDEDKKDEFLEITSEDCENECVEFEEEKDLLYCRQICGLAAPKEVSKENCGSLTGLEKDYCLKDSAVANKDFKICQEIKDINIKKTCQNRITEEILNGNSELISN